MSTIANRLPVGSSGATEKRKKQIVLVGGLILVVIVVFQVLRLGGGSPSSASPVASGVVTVGSVAGVPTTEPAPSGVATSGAGPLASPSPASRRALEKMPLKDPFVPLIAAAPNSTGAGSAETPLPSKVGPRTAAPPTAAPTTAAPTPVEPAASAPPASAPPAAAPSVDSSSGGLPPVDVSAPAPTEPIAAPPAPLTGAIISINGSSQTIARSELFPEKAPAFRLLKVGRTFVQIGVAGGSFTGGRTRVTIRRGRRVTLVNTATGVRYVFRYAAPSTASAEAAPEPAPVPGDN